MEELSSFRVSTAYLSSLSLFPTLIMLPEDVFFAPLMTGWTNPNVCCSTYST